MNIDTKFKRWLYTKDEGTWIVWPTGCVRSDAVPLPSIPFNPSDCLLALEIPALGTVLRTWSSYCVKRATLGMPRVWPLWMSILVNTHHPCCPLQSDFQMTPAQMLSDCSCLRQSKQQMHSWAESVHGTVKVIINCSFKPQVWKWKCLSLSCDRLLVTPWMVAHQAPLSMEFSRQEYWSESPFPSPGDLPDPGTEPGAPALQADSLLSGPTGKQQ